MNDLKNLQKNFQNYLLHGQTNIEKLIVDSPPRDKRLTIYRNAYQVRLINALASNYPCIKAVLGNVEFEKLGLAYIEAYPSSYCSIRWFGNNLLTFITGSSYLIEYPFLAELADFEWKMTLAFDASDSEIINLEQVSSIPAQAWAHIVFIPHPSIQRMNLFWNVISIWQYVIKEDQPEPLMKHTRQTPWVLWRKNYINCFYALPEDEAWAMDGMIQGMTFGELCEGLGAFVEEKDIGMRAASLLNNWIQSGLLANIKF